MVLEVRTLAVPCTGNGCTLRALLQVPGNRENLDAFVKPGGPAFNAARYPLLLDFPPNSSKSHEFSVPSIQRQSSRCLPAAQGNRQLTRIPSLLCSATSPTCSCARKASRGLCLFVCPLEAIAGLFFFVRAEAIAAAVLYGEGCRSGGSWGTRLSWFVSCRRRALAGFEVLSDVLVRGRRSVFCLTKECGRTCEEENARGSWCC